MMLLASFEVGRARELSRLAAPGRLPAVSGCQSRPYFAIARAIAASASRSSWSLSFAGTSVPLRQCSSCTAIRARQASALVSLSSYFFAMFVISFGFVDLLGQLLDGAAEAVALGPEGGGVLLQGAGALEDRVRDRADMCGVLAALLRVVRSGGLVGDELGVGIVHGLLRVVVGAGLTARSHRRPVSRRSECSVRPLPAARRSRAPQVRSARTGDGARCAP